MPPAASEPGPDGSPQPAAAPRRRRWLWPALAVAAILALALIAGGAISWHYSSQVLVPDHSGWPEDVSVERVEPGQVVLERTEETLQRGVNGLAWQGGSAIVGRVRARDEDTVTRALLRVRGYLVAGMDVGLDWNVYAGDPRQTLGLPFDEVEIEGELGPMPAWLIPAPGESTRQARDGDSDRTWAIFVHGINSSMQTGLRIAPSLRGAGMTSLLITYRDDLGAPESPDGYHHMGLTEWRDLEAAVRYALDRHARRIVLVGYSMGGAIVAQFMQKSPLADRVGALVLDAPALDWRRILEFNATEMGLPGFLALPVEWAIAARVDADWDSLDALRHSEDFELPILLFHGTEDEIVPIGISDDFAEELPRWVEYHRVPGAGHTQSWNVDPKLYERRVGRFLENSLQIGRKPGPQRAQNGSEPDRSRARAAE